MKKHVLNEIWNDFPHVFDSETLVIRKATQIGKIIKDMMAIGPFYHFVLNLPDSSLTHCSEDMLDIHPLKEYPTHLEEIIALIHPDDIAYVKEAERLVIDKYVEIGVEYALSLKNSYCFRMKNRNGKYEMFHHQSIPININEDGRLLQAINIHTNIQHVTPINSHTIVVAGIGDRHDFHQITYKESLLKKNVLEELTKREREILQYIASGNTSGEIAQICHLSNHTIWTHRKNILCKTNTKNSSELVKKCLEWGLL